MALSCLLKSPIAPETPVPGLDLVQGLYPGLHDVLVGPAQRPQRPNVVMVRPQELPAVPVGAQRVRQDVRVERVVLVSGRLIPGNDP